MSQQHFQQWVEEMKGQSDEACAIYLKEKFMMLLHYSRRLKYPIPITDKRIKYIDPLDIIYAEARENYTLIHYEMKGSPATYLSPYNLGTLEFELCICGLIRIHRSHMVQPRYVDEFDTEGEFILLTNGIKLAVPLEKIHRVKELMKRGGGRLPSTKH